MRRGAEFSIMLGTNELMNSRLSGSEAALATLAAKKMEAVKKPHLLIGGLGMGFTLRAALAVLGTEARIVVAELVPAVIAWARGPMAEIFGDSLSDPRVRIDETDVSEIIRSHQSKFDAILLDVDNGPEGLTRKANDALYRFGRIECGLRGAAARRRPRRLVVGAQCGVFKTASRRRLRCQRGCRARHRTRRRRASRHLDRDQRQVASLRTSCCCSPDFPGSPARRPSARRSCRSRA